MFLLGIFLPWKSHKCFNTRRILSYKASLSYIFELSFILAYIANFLTDKKKVLFRKMGFFFLATSRREIRNWNSQFRRLSFREFSTSAIANMEYIFTFFFRLRFSSPGSPALRIFEYRFSLSFSSFFLFFSCSFFFFLYAHSNLANLNFQIVCCHCFNIHGLMYLWIMGSGSPAIIMEIVLFGVIGGLTWIYSCWMFVYYRVRTFV